MAEARPPHSASERLSLEPLGHQAGKDLRQPRTGEVARMSQAHLHGDRRHQRHHRQGLAEHARGVRIDDTDAGPLGRKPADRARISGLQRRGRFRPGFVQRLPERNTQFVVRVQGQQPLA